MSSWTLTSKGDGELENDISLKDVLLDVSRKLDRFLETHNTLHGEMARRDSRHEAQAEARQRDIDEMRHQIDDLEDWQVEVRGQLKLVKWATSGGLVAVAAMLLRVLGVPVP